MMEMVNSSRFGVALMGLGIHRRSFLEAAIYAARRSQFGHRIDTYPLVRETLVDLLVDLEAGMSVTYECAAAERTATDVTAGRLVRRILVPLAKMRCTRTALQAASTALEVFGGNGYMEDWPMARQLRDAQCHTIWEGTENILCIDVRRAMRGEQAHLALFTRMEQALDTATGHKVLGTTVDTVASRAAVSPSCWATSPRVPSWWSRRHGPSITTATPARRRWPGASPRGGCPPRRGAASPTLTAWCSTSSSPSSATARSRTPTWPPDGG
jgi:hypothetical protein